MCNQQLPFGLNVSDEIDCSTSTKAYTLHCFVLFHSSSVTDSHWRTVTSPKTNAKKTWATLKKTLKVKQQQQQNVKRYMRQFCKITNTRTSYFVMLMSLEISFNQFVMVQSAWTKSLSVWLSVSQSQSRNRKKEKRIWTFQLKIVSSTVSLTKLNQCR